MNQAIVELNAQIEELNKLIEDSQEHRSRLTLQKNELRREAYKLLKAEYTYTTRVTKMPENSWSKHPQPGTDLVKVIGTLKNSQSFEDYIQAYGTTINMPNDTISITYYRLGNVIITDGGGHCILDAPEVISDEDWQSLLDGVVPEHLIRWGKK
jgi:hypothetical protein